MEQLKFALGEYEVFASIVGGSPIVLAIFLICNPSNNFQILVSTINSNLSIPVALLIVFFSYILGGSVQGITWKYFLFLCKLFRLDYTYLGNMISERNALLTQPSEIQVPSVLEFEDKLVFLLREKIGIPKNVDWLNPRLTAYLKERSSLAVITAESFMANHIMYRNMSFGFLLLSIVVLVNILRTWLFTFDQLMLILLFLLISYLTFFRSLSFKSWNSRELLLGFYFSACNSVQ
jgi:hypothetical protein